MPNETIAQALEEFEKAIAADDELKKAEHELVVLGEGEIDSKVPGYISTQCPILNWAIGRPGVPVGRLTTIIGLEASGKSTVGQHILAETQQQGGIAVLIDSERRYWSDRATAMGIDNSNLVQLRGDTLEQNLALIEKFIQTTRKLDPDVPLTIVYDSIAGSATRADLAMNYESSATPAMHARLLGVALRRIHPMIAAHKVTLVFVNQLRQKLEMGFSSFGRPKMVMVAEHPLTYWSSLKIHLQQAQRVGGKDEATGIVVACEVIKNTTAPPFRKCQFNIDFQTGIDYADSAFALALEIGLLKGSAGWYQYEGIEKKFQRKDFGSVLEQSEELRGFLEAAPLLWQKE